jgi:hypothetical protein
MTPDERNLLNQFLSDLNKTQGVAKDAEAAQMIETAFKANPDAPYVLTQHALLADQALHQAQQQIEALQAELQRAQPAPQQGQSGGSFFGGAGLGPSVAQPQSGGQAPWVQAAQPQYGQPQYGQPQYAPPPPQGGGFFGGGPFSGQRSGLGSFLQTAGTTAAGVAGGAFLFEGLSNLFGGGHGFGGGGFGGAPVENVTINNYGDDSGGYDDDPGTSGDIGGDDYS